MVDNQRLKQVLANLLSNAIKYSPDGGTGLGLAITRELVTCMGGTIDFQTTEGKRTRFFFRLPSADTRKVSETLFELNGEADNIAWLAKPIQQQKLIDLVQRQLSDGGRPTILHIEDDADLHDVISAMVSDRLILERAGTMADAKKLLEQHAYDAVLLDIGLPDGSGWDLIPDIENEQPNAAIVILSGEDISKAKHSAVEDVLLKNRLTSDQLVSVIRERTIKNP